MRKIILIMMVFYGFLVASATLADATCGEELPVSTFVFSKGGTTNLFVLSGVIFVQEGGGALVEAPTLYLFSGMLDSKGIYQPFDVVLVRCRIGFFSYSNLALQFGAPVVEHFWGSANPDGTMPLVRVPEDPWVSYDKDEWGQPILSTLSIGVFMCPNGIIKPLKSLNLEGNLNKLPPGVYPELAEYCY